MVSVKFTVKYGIYMTSEKINFSRAYSVYSFYSKGFFLVLQGELGRFI